MRIGNKRLLSAAISVCLVMNSLSPTLAFAKEGIARQQIEAVSSAQLLSAAEQMTTTTSSAAIKLAKNNASNYLSEQLANTYEYDAANGGTDWQAFALARGGSEVPAEYAASVLKWLSDCNTKEEVAAKIKTPSTAARLALGLSACGYDVTNVKGCNLIELIYNGEGMDQVYATVPLYALLTLDSRKYEIPAHAVNTRESLISLILKYQQADGAFNAGYGASVDVTAMAIQALAPYCDENSEIKEAADKALQWLSDQQAANGGYALTDWSDNCCALAQAICAAAAMGKDPLEDAGFNKENGSLMSHLLDFYNGSEGAFNNNIGGEVDPTWATPQAVYAMAAYERLLEGKTSLFDLSDVPADKNLESSKVVLVTEADNKVDLSKDKPTTIYVSSNTDKGQLDISGCKEQMPAVKIIGADYKVEIPADTAVTSNDIEVIMLPYTHKESSVSEIQSGLQAQLGSSVKVSDILSHLSIGDTHSAIQFDQKVKIVFKNLAGSKAAYKDHTGEVSNITKIKQNEDKSAYSEVCYDQGKNLVVETNHFTDFYVYNTEASAGGGASPDKEQTVKVSVSADSVNKGTLYSGEIVLQEGDTALSILNRTGLSIDANGSGSSMYIVGIDGLNEYDHGPKSGWMYSVNGTFPNKAAGSYKLSAGDEVKWQYTKDLGEDIGNPGTAGGTGNGLGVSDTTKVTMKAMLSSITKNWQREETLSQWQLFALAKAKAKVKNQYITELVQQVKDNEGNYRKPTDLEAMVLTLGSLGVDCQNAAGIDLSKKIYDHQNLALQGSNGLMFALIALDSKAYKVPADAKWSRDKLKTAILSYQNNDGGFALVEGKDSEADITAMAIQALAPYKNESAIKAAIERAVTYLASIQKSNGQFETGEDENSESIAQIIIALSTLKIDVASDTRFIKEDKNLIDLLLEYSVAEKGFCHTKGEGYNAIATEQCTMALISYNSLLNSEASLYDLSSIKIDSTDKEEDKENEEENALESYKDSGEVSGWAQEELTRAIQLGIIKGYGDSLKPQQEVTRAEFTVMLIRAVLNEEQAVSSQQIFKDVSQGSWFYKEVMLAYNNGFITGIDKEHFNPSDHINREQAAVIISRKMAQAKQAAEKANFSDQKHISSWAQEAVAKVYAEQLFKGYEDGSFRPKQAMTRETAAIIILRLKEKTA